MSITVAPKSCILECEAYSACRFGSFVMLGVDFFRECSVGLQSWVEHSVTCLDESLGCAAELLYVLPASTRVLVVRPLGILFLKWRMEAYQPYKTHLILVIN